MVTSEHMGIILLNSLRNNNIGSRRSSRFWTPGNWGVRPGGYHMWGSCASIIDQLIHLKLMPIYIYIYTAYNRCKEDTYIDHIQKICGTAWLSWWALPMIPRSQWFLQSLLTRNTWFLEDGWWYDDTKFVWSSIRMSHCVNWDRPRISIVL